MASQVSIALRDETAFVEMMGRVVAAIHQQTDQKIAALEIKISRLESAMSEFKFVGQWQPHKSYRAGNFCSLGGQIFHCDRDTDSRPGTNSDWTLAVKSGRDGRDGKDGAAAAPAEPPEPRTVRTAERSSSSDVVVRRR
jgi:hypothetical protein